MNKINSNYNHKQIEKFVTELWNITDFYKIDLNDQTKNKKYFLDMFPYPSSNGLHVGHIRGYLATDIQARYYLLLGYNVFKPIGWDAFGLPAEQYAIKNNKQPKEFVLKNINNFRKQLKKIGFYFNYDQEINTSDPAYYRTTQWIFLKLFKNKLALKSNVSVNWCQELKTTLAKEEIIKIENKYLSERGNYPVIKKNFEQWILKITSDAERLEKELININWPKDVIKLQKNWIKTTPGFLTKVEICLNKKIFLFDVFIKDYYFKTFCPSFLGITLNSKLFKIIKSYLKASDLKKIESILKKYYQFEAEYYLEEWNAFNAWNLNINVKEKCSNTTIPLFLVTRIHSQLNLNEEIFFLYDLKAFVYRKFLLHNKNIFNKIKLDFLLENKQNKNLNISKINKIKLIENKIILPTFKNHLHDWVFSRQRYWGEPIPILFKNGRLYGLKEDQLPLILPETKNFHQVYKSFPPLEYFKNWVNIKINKHQYKRETNVMPQWAGSCWYYIAYLLKTKDGYLNIDSKKGQKILNHWLPVDIYIGGKEHAVLHLLYARFWHHFLYDQKLVNCLEPFQTLVNQGLILNEHGEKMSKSADNFVSPDQILDQYGADALRVYEMFIGPLDKNAKWQTHGVFASYRWLKRVYTFFTQLIVISTNFNQEFLKVWKETIYQIPKEIKLFKFNTSISKLMIFINFCYKNNNIPLNYVKAFLQIFSLFCPFLSEFLWNHFSFKENLAKSKLSSLLKDD